MGFEAWGTHSYIYIFICLYLHIYIYTHIYIYIYIYIIAVLGILPPQLPPWYGPPLPRRDLSKVPTVTEMGIQAKIWAPNFKFCRLHFFNVFCVISAQVADHVTTNEWQLRSCAVLSATAGYEDGFFNFSFGSTVTLAQTGAREGTEAAF